VGAGAAGREAVERNEALRLVLSPSGNRRAGTCQRLWDRIKTDGG